jgi:REP element-mobilizing transposase RayT
VFALFDPEADVRVTVGNLPHWYQPNVTYFITFRTDDSIPSEVVIEWHARRAEWLRRHKINSTAADWAQQLLALPRALRREFHNEFSDAYLEALDRGHGECVLKRPPLAEIVARSLRHFDGERYLMGDFVVMPNHVHLLVCLVGSTDVKRLCYSWKKYTAGEINAALGRTGRFWQEESFDHLVRSPEQFERLRSYIADNPRKAGLRDGDYLLWQRPSG